jgi:hypothetical protein
LTEFWYDYDDDLISNDYLIGIDGRIYALRDEFQATPDIEFYNMNKDNMVSINFEYRCPFVYRKRVGGEYNYVLHLEQPYVKPALRPKD